MALSKKQCEFTLDLFGFGGTSCGTPYAAEVASEYGRWSAASTHELQNTRAALRFHPWANTPDEQARLEAIEHVLRIRQLPRLMLPTTKSGSEFIPGTDLVRFRRRRSH